MSQVELPCSLVRRIHLLEQPVEVDVGFTQSATAESHLQDPENLLRSAEREARDQGRAPTLKDGVNPPLEIRDEIITGFVLSRAVCRLGDKDVDPFRDLGGFSGIDRLEPLRREIPRKQNTSTTTLDEYHRRAQDVSSANQPEVKIEPKSISTPKGTSCICESVYSRSAAV